MANHLLGKHFRLWLCFRLAFAANILHNSARRRSRRKCNALQAINNFHFFIKLCRSRRRHRRRRRQSANVDVDVDVDVNVPVCAMSWTSSMRFESLLFLMACVAMPQDVARHKHLPF